jgi:hypothetical protein
MGEGVGTAGATAGATKGVGTKEIGTAGETAGGTADGTAGGVPSLGVKNPDCLRPLKWISCQESRAGASLRNTRPRCMLTAHM